MNGDHVITLEGMTSQLQVLDVVVNNPFKDNLWKRRSDWLLSGNHTLTRSGKIQMHAVSFDVWMDSPHTACSFYINRFKKYSISNFLDGGSNDLLWEEQVGSEDVNDDTDSEEVNLHTSPEKGKGKKKKRSDSSL